MTATEITSQDHDNARRNNAMLVDALLSDRDRVNFFNYLIGYAGARLDPNAVAEAFVSYTQSRNPRWVLTDY